MKQKYTKLQSSKTCLTAEPIAEEILQIDLSHLEGEHGKKIKAIGSYLPNKQHDYPISMKICLTDDIRVFQGPRRISYCDRYIVDKQIEEWMKNR